MAGLFFHSVGNVIIPTDELTTNHFSGWGRAKNHRPDIVTLGDISIYIYILTI